MGLACDDFSKPVQGYFMQPQNRVSPESPAHILGGGEFELTCTCCGQFMDSLIRLDVRDIRLELGALPLSNLPLLACREHFRNCFQYSFTSAGECLLLGNNRNELLHHLPRTMMRTPAPQPFLLHAIPDRIVETRRLVREGRIEEVGEWAIRFDWGEPHNQVGGMPLLLSSQAANPACSLCGRPMPFLASVMVDIENELGEEQGFGQSLYFLCRSCACVAARSDFSAEDYS